MNFEDYARQMFMKYRLALAIAVIRNKPDNLSTDQYLTELKENIEQAEVSDQILQTADLNFDDNDFNFDDNEDSLISYGDNNILPSNSDCLTHDACSIDLLQDFTNFQEVSRTNESVVENEENSLDEVLNTLRDIDENQDRILSNFHTASQENSNIVRPTSFQHLNENIADENMALCRQSPENNVDFINLVSTSDTQIPVDERIRTNVERNINKRINLSKAAEINNPGKNDNIKENILKNTYDMEVDMVLNEIHGNQYGESSMNNIKNNTVETVQQRTNESNNNTRKDNKAVINKNVETNNLNERLNVSTNTIEISAEDTILYTLNDFTQNNSHISQSQYQNIDIPPAFIHGNRNNYIDEDVTASDVNVNQGLDKAPTVLTVNPGEIHYIIDHSGKTYELLQSIQLNKDVRNSNHTINISQEKHEQVKSQKVKKGHNDTSLNDEETNQTDDIEFIDIEDDFVKEFDSEVVPFKVVKELSKVKTYLDRKERKNSTDGSSSDSGYRSDSQSSFKSSHLSDDWIPQSGHCLYNYIIQCPLVSVTQEIVTEISSVLGKLIDRLHLEEKYPPFLEELLEKVDSLLRDLSLQPECFENILLDKDETIQRLLCLNKSTHILKFSLEKIVTILEKTHSNLTAKESLYELTSIQDVENSRYIFYVLEIFLQMYVKHKDTASQGSQTSQETKIFKKSSITEIWRKKWNPNVKETKNVSSQEKGCVLTKCGEILNKLVVDCMEGYSLVSFAALQCFNLLQN